MKKGLFQSKAFSLLLIVALLFCMAPQLAFTAYADESTQFEVSASDCQLIGEYMNEDVYYVTAPVGTTEVVFKDVEVFGQEKIGEVYEMLVAKAAQLMSKDDSASFNVGDWFIFDQARDGRDVNPHYLESAKAYIEQHEGDLVGSGNYYSNYAKAILFKHPDTTKDVGEDELDAICHNVDNQFH